MATEGRQGSLSLSRRVGQRLVISFRLPDGEMVTLAVVTVSAASGGVARIRCEADKRIIVMRNELVGLPDDPRAGAA